MRVSFIQIAVAVDNLQNECLYGLDEDGVVWVFQPAVVNRDTAGWRKLPMNILKDPEPLDAEQECLHAQEDE